MVRDIAPARRPVSGTVRVPGSKSITNRALVLGALAGGVTRLEGALFSDDTALMVGGLRALGVRVDGEAAAQRFTVRGQGGRVPAAEAAIDAGNAGTVARFLTALATLGSGRYVVDGSPRMRERPIGDLVDALRVLGADLDAPSGCPPVVVRGRGLAGGHASVRGEISSQFLSALLLVAPLARSRVDLAVEGSLVGEPYVEMTLRMMEAFGVKVRRVNAAFRVAPQAYQARTYAVEPDASSASYFFAAAAITGGRVAVPGLTRESLQGDVGFLGVMAQMGCEVRWSEAGVTVRGPERLRGVDVDLNGMSDMTMTLAAMAPFAEGSMRIRNVAHVRRQESNRLAALATELRRIGQEVREFEDGLEVHPRPVRAAVVQTYGDHRIAMAFAVTGLRAEGISVADPHSVTKTFPEFFETLDRLARDAGLEVPKVPENEPGEQGISLEPLRRRFKPNSVKVLFIGESPPANGTFFYRCDSNLCRYTREGFSINYGMEFPSGNDFLEFFKTRGCYLDDLCSLPVNRLSEAQRGQVRQRAVNGLANRIREYRPEAVVLIMKGITKQVKKALEQAEQADLPFFNLPFPAQGNQRKYVEQLDKALGDLRRQGIL